MRRKDKYGRGSAAVNGEGFVDLAPGDTFAALEEQLKRRIADRFDNPALGISASIGSKRNAGELAKHLASGEEEEAHKFAAKNIGVLFAKGGMGIVHFDKKAVDETREKPKIFRVFSPFVFAEEPLVATITIKPADDGLRLYAIEALDIMRGERLEVHLAAEPRQFKTSRLLLMGRISYYVGDVNRTHPKFVGRAEPFTVDRTVELLENLMTSAIGHQPPTTNHQPPKFSIIIPVYNVAPYLRKCLDSVLAQTFTDWEAICVDDGSTDESGVVLDDYARRDRRIRVCHQSNAGVSAARNRGLSLVLGRWVAFADGDDYVDADWLLNFKRCFEKTGAEVVYSGCVPFDHKVIPARRGAAGDYDVKSLEDVSSWIWGCYSECGYVVAYAYEASVLRDHRFAQGVALSEDSLFGFALAGTVNRAVRSTYAGYFYCQRNDSAVRAKLRSEERLRFLMGIRRVLAQSSGGESKRRAVIGLAWRNFIGWAIRSADQDKLVQIKLVLRDMWKRKWLRLGDLKWHWRVPFLMFVWFGWMKPLRTIGIWLSKK